MNLTQAEAVVRLVTDTSSPVHQAEAGQKLADFIHRYRTRTGQDWKLDRVYMSRGGKLKAVITNPFQRQVLRYSQNRWKKSD